METKMIVVTKVQFKEISVPDMHDTHAFTYDDLVEMDYSLPLIGERREMSEGDLVPLSEVRRISLKSERFLVRNPETGEKFEIALANTSEVDMLLGEPLRAIRILKKEIEKRDQENFQCYRRIVDLQNQLNENLLTISNLQSKSWIYKLRTLFK